MLEENYLGPVTGLVMGVVREARDLPPRRVDPLGNPLGDPPRR